MINQINATPTAEQKIDAIMEQAQVLASAWAFLGGPFDNGSGLATAERERATLRTMLAELRRYTIGDLSSPAPAAGDALPPLDDDLIEILGRPNFACAELATLLRAGGHSIKNKAEHEQAAVIHFLLGHYLKHGAAWHEHVGAAFEAIAQQAQRKEA